MKESLKERIWITSDTHFFHNNILKYNRPFFNSVEEMNEHIINEWNNYIKKEDIVYHLGDFAFGYDLERIEMLFHRLNGTKRLIVGNHDTSTKIALYCKLFDKVLAIEKFPDEGIILSHIPLHPSELNYGFNFNIHGHLHSEKIPDIRYKNVCWDIERKFYKLTDILSEFSKLC